MRQSGIKVRILQYICTSLIGMLLHTPLHAADLMDVYREALEQDAQYSSARAAYQAAQEKLPQGQPDCFPQLPFKGYARDNL